MKLTFTIFTKFITCSEMKIWNSTITMINLTNHKNNEEHVHHFNVSRSAFSETFDGQVLTFDQIHFLPSLVSIQHLYSRGPREIDIYSWLERLLSTIALYLTCLKQIKWKLQNFWRWEQTSQKAVDYTQQLIRGIFTTTLQVNYNQILMLVFM